MPALTFSQPLNAEVRGPDLFFSKLYLLGCRFRSFSQGIVRNDTANFLKLFVGLCNQLFLTLRLETLYSTTNTPQTRRIDNNKFQIAIMFAFT